MSFLSSLSNWEFLQSLEQEEDVGPSAWRNQPSGRAIKGRLVTGRETDRTKNRQTNFDRTKYEAFVNRAEKRTPRTSELKVTLGQEGSGNTFCLRRIEALRKRNNRQRYEGFLRGESVGKRRFIGPMTWLFESKIWPPMGLEALVQLVTRSFARPPGPAHRERQRAPPAPRKHHFARLVCSGNIFKCSTLIPFQKAFQTLFQIEEKPPHFIFSWFSSSAELFLGIDGRNVLI